MDYSVGGTCSFAQILVHCFHFCLFLVCKMHCVTLPLSSSAMQKCGKLEFAFIFKRYLHVSVCFHWQAFEQRFSRDEINGFWTAASYCCCIQNATFMESSNSNPFSFTFIVIACKIYLKYISFFVLCVIFLLLCRVQMKRKKKLN